MTFKKGNKLWQMRSKDGRPPIYSSPDQLWEECCGYFEWIEANPLWEEKPFHFQGEVTDHPVRKMRAMTLGGLCLYLDIDRTTWKDYCTKVDFSQVTTRVEEIIRDQKFSGAAAELLNPQIIARDLGLQDKVSNIHSGPDGGPIQTQDVSGMSDDELQAIINGGKSGDQDG